MNKIAIVKIIIATTLGLNALSQMAVHQTWWFIQNVNLIFHEAGHAIFYFFGNFLMTLGGSLLEILVPLLVVIHFVRTKQNFSAAVTCWWLFTAFLSVSIYAADAQERALPLITNDIASHDWFNLLVSMNILQYDTVVGYVFFCGGLLSTLGILYFTSKDKDVAELLTKIKNT